MKYLKYFENNTYQEISDDNTFDIDLSDDNLEQFTQREVDTILAVWPNVRKFKDGTQNGSTSNFIMNDKFRLRVNKTEITIELIKKLDFGKEGPSTVYPTAYTIYKMKDEWFILSDYIKSNHYRCDQIDGVTDCLKSIIPFMSNDPLF